MRLNDNAVNGIIQGILPFLSNQKADLRLYGSRVNDNLKGGDIDLLLIAENDKAADSLLLNKHKILASIKSYIGEQRIDLKITHKKECTEDPFLKLILPESIQLYRF